MTPYQRLWWCSLGTAASLIQRICNRILRIILPRNAWGDFVVAWASHVFYHRRFPRRYDPKRINDHFFKMKVSGELLNPLRQFVSDKEYVKHYITAIVGRRHILETFEILRSAAEVDQLLLDRFPCVIKPTHLSGHVLFYPDSDKPLDRELLKRWLKLNRYKIVREVNYRYLEPKIIVEEFFSEDGQTPANDYKVHCFNGVPKLIQVDANRFVQPTRVLEGPTVPAVKVLYTPADADRFIQQTKALYDTSWNRLPVGWLHRQKEEDDPKPAQLSLMLDVATRLSEPFSLSDSGYIRVDMYTSGTEVRVGELTNCPGGSNDNRFRPAAAEFALGRLFEHDRAYDVASLT